jgi:hypothetical protein
LYLVFIKQNKKMVKYIIVGLSAALLASCTPKAPEVAQEESEVVENYSFFGDQVAPENAVEVKYLTERIAGNDSLAIKLVGSISEVCQSKGCWMTIELENGQKMRVTFKDYGFFVPKDASGKTVVIDGLAYQSVTSVDELRHYAEDAGKTAEEIAAITDSKQEVTFTAGGVAILN